MNTETFKLVTNALPNALTIEQCKKLNTKRLLAFYKKYRHKQHYGKCGCCGEILNESDKPIYKALGSYFHVIRKELDKREHVS